MMSFNVMYSVIKLWYNTIFSVDTSDSDEQMDANEVVHPEQSDGTESMAQADEHVHVEGVCVCASTKLFYC